MRTEVLFDVHVDLAPSEVIGPTPIGVRTVHIVTGGTFEGPRLRGAVRPGGGDWLLTASDGTSELDVRVSLKTGDGGLIIMTYRGVLDIAPDLARRIMAGEEIPPSRYYFRTTPRFETGSETYAWLNKLVCVGLGRFGRQWVEYRVFAVL